MIELTVAFKQLAFKVNTYLSKASCKYFSYFIGNTTPSVLGNEDQMNEQLVNDVSTSPKVTCVFHRPMLTYLR